MFSDADKALIEQGAKALMTAAGKAAEIGVRGVMAEGLSQFLPPFIGAVTCSQLFRKALKLEAKSYDDAWPTVAKVVSGLTTLVFTIGAMVTMSGAIVALAAPEWVLMKTILKVIRP